MISDALQQELFVNSPTFRRQVAGALTTVGIERWKLAVGTILTINAAEAAGATLTAEELVGPQRGDYPLGQYAAGIRRLDVDGERLDRRAGDGQRGDWDTT